MRIKGLLDRTKALRNTNCLTMEAFGVDIAESQIRAEIAQALLAAGFKGAAVEAHCDHAVSALINLRRSIEAIHYQTDGLAGELDRTNNALKARGAEPIF